MTISGMTNSDATTYTIQVTVSDDNYWSAAEGILTDSTTFSLTIDPINSAPTFDSTHADKTAYVYTALYYTMPSYSDFDSDTLTYTVVEQFSGTLPSFMSLSGRQLTVYTTSNGDGA
jgi:hypothetical protein